MDPLGDHKRSENWPCSRNEVLWRHAPCTAWLIWKMWQSCVVIKAPSVQPTFVYFLLTTQPYPINFGPLHQTILPMSLNFQSHSWSQTTRETSTWWSSSYDTRKNCTKRDERVNFSCMEWLTFVTSRTFISLGHLRTEMKNQFKWIRWSWNWNDFFFLISFPNRTLTPVFAS